MLRVPRMLASHSRNAYPRRALLRWGTRSSGLNQRTHQKAGLKKSFQYQQMLTLIRNTILYISWPDLLIRSTFHLAPYEQIIRNVLALLSERSSSPTTWQEPAVSSAHLVLWATPRPRVVPQYLKSRRKQVI